MAKKKAEYTSFDNIKYSIRNTWKWDKKVLVCTVLSAPIKVILPFIGIYMSGEIVRMVTNSYEPQRIVVTTLILLLLILLFKIIDNNLSRHVELGCTNNRFKYVVEIMRKTYTTDFENIESTNGRNLLNISLENTMGSLSPAEILVKKSVDILTSAVGIFTYAAVIIILNPWIMLVVLVSSVINALLLKRKNIWLQKYRAEISVPGRKLYYIEGMSRNFVSGKDIRIYGMGGWFTDLFNKHFKERVWWCRKAETQSLQVDVVSGILTFVRDMLSYGYLVYLLFTNGLPVDMFVFYFGLIGGFSTWITQIIESLTQYDDANIKFGEIRRYLDMPDKQRKGGMRAPTNNFSIEFKNVSFKYPESDKYILKNVSFKIKDSGKIAVVGMNGAGKTTLIKLLCGLYDPTEGEIILSGKNITEYDLSEYYSTFCAVFQDINFLPMPIEKNITFGDTDNERLFNSIRLAGLSEKIDALPNKEKTKLIKSVFDDAVDLSGGETQKLALARALYKGGNILVLDEPTAALDPIAENNMYMRYNEMAENKTSIFISHRLASTRFCDRILFLDNGNFTESGTHDELMKLGGKYREIYDMQSHYYNEGGENDVCESI